MRNFLLITLSIFVFINTSFSQKKLFDGNKYKIYDNRVEQNKYEAIASNDSTIKSNYMGMNVQGLMRPVAFKFSINGLDNERAPSNDHLVYFNPDKGSYTTPVFEFGVQEPANLTSPNRSNEYLLKKSEFDVTFRVDMSEIIKSFSERGYFKTYDGGIIMKEDFKGVYVAGDTEPLTWEFTTLLSRPDLKMNDDNGDGIFEVNIHFANNPVREVDADGYAVWKLQKNLNPYPQFHSDITLLNALYNMSLEEMIEDIRSDSAFCAGLKWPGVWTRDISYSIILSLALVNPDASKVSLLAKVSNGKIIEDTGTGGSWPVSTDRMIWTLAAWEIYCVTGDVDWLKTIYPIIKNSAEADLKTVLNPQTGLMYGESSFLDWREQTYPGWMEPKDIYQSHCLGTNAVHYQSFKILAEAAKLLGEDGIKYDMIAEKIKTAINKYLWMEDKDYFAQYLYGGNYYSISPRSETLGEALCVLFGISDETQSGSIIKSIPVLDFGATCIYPQIPGLPPYHNNGIWSFVEAYLTWASKKVNNSASIENGLAAIYRAASLFLTNKENFVAENGHYEGTEINSDRQLWSVAGNLATVYRIIFGLEFSPEELTISPAIPKVYSGNYNLKNVKFRDAVLNISISGYGSMIEEFKLDGKVVSSNKIGKELKGGHNIEITLACNDFSGEISIVENKFSPQTPQVNLDNGILKWENINSAVSYSIYKNGELISTANNCQYNIGDSDLYAEYQIKATGKDGIESFLSEPVTVSFGANQIIYEPASIYNLKQEMDNYSGEGYIVLSKNENTKVEFEIYIKEDGNYFLDFRYANGNGPLNTKNMCAVRTLKVDGKIERAVVFPQRGDLVWDNWGYTNYVKLYLEKGKHILTLSLENSNENMNGEINTALLDMLRLTRAEKMN